MIESTTYTLPPISIASLAASSVLNAVVVPVTFLLPLVISTVPLRATEVSPLEVTKEDTEPPEIVVLSIVPSSISTLEILTSPVPLGVRSILPFVLIEVIALPSTLILSTSKASENLA